MPPFLPQTRFRSESPDAGSSKTASNPTVNPRRRKPTLFDDLDAGTRTNRTAEHTKAILEKLAANDEDDESSLSSLSSSDEFEDVPNGKRRKTQPVSEDDDDEEDIEFEDVHNFAAPVTSAPAPSIGDLELTLRKDTRVSLTNPLGTKKGPSKIERGIRLSTHKVHVQTLMWHNAVRNAWLCDRELQDILVKQLPPSLESEIDRWKRDSGLVSAEEQRTKSPGKVKGKNVRGKKADARSQRDWGEPATRLGAGEVNRSGGDPIFRLLKLLASFWKHRFRVTAPGLRKLGYMSLERLDEEMKHYHKEQHDPERHGERIRNIKELRNCAINLEGSRDVGAQLFTALLRGLGLEARMVASLQPVGFGWSQAEEELKKNPRKLKNSKKTAPEGLSEDGDDSNDCEDDNPPPERLKKALGKAVVAKKTPVKSIKYSASRISRANGLKQTPIELSDPSEISQESSDAESVVDVTPAKKTSKPSLPYDKDLRFPHYWTEVLSPVTNTFTPVDAVVLHIIATNKELLEKFETRGSKADKAKQVTAYIIGHSSDGSAKDVTTRYLKRHIWPGRTKGNRIPAERIPVRNRHGKIKRYEESDWFKTVMSGYTRGSHKHYPRTDIDDHEEATILKPAKAEKKEVEEGKETLQYYKSSEEFVLERHLRREEALLPTAKHVKIFIMKGKGETPISEKVYLRKDVVPCKTMETWHKEGRAPIPGEEPLKRVPYRAATTNRKRELAEAEKATGEKMLQGLYSRKQTDWIIPPPIENGVIPKNEYGNMDVYVPSMVPDGAVHIPRRGTAKICKRLGFDFAEAVTGFEFGHRMAVPVITGVVVAEENLDVVLEEWEKDEVERVRKEDEKRRKTAVAMWRKMLMGMRIVERVREEYGGEEGDEVDVFNPWTNKNKGKKSDRAIEAKKRIVDQRDEDMAGGFFPEGHHEEEIEEPHNSSNFFPTIHTDDEDGEGGGGFIVEGHEKGLKRPSHLDETYPTPQSLAASTKRGAAHASDEDLSMPDLGGQEAVTIPAPAPAPKRRGRPPGSGKKPPIPKSAPTARKSSTSHSRKGLSKRDRAAVADTDTDADDTKSQSEQDSPPSDFPSSESSFDLHTITTKAKSKSNSKGKPKSKPRTAILPPQASPVALTKKKTPVRKAARKSQSETRSRYFEHDGSESEGEGS